MYYDKEFELTPIHFPYWLNAGDHVLECSSKKGNTAYNFSLSSLSDNKANDQSCSSSFCLDQKNKDHNSKSACELGSIANNFHNYYDKTGTKKQRKKLKVHDDFKLLVNCPIILNNDCIPDIIDDHLNEVIDGIEIAECVTISSNDCENYLNNELHEKQYEANILKRADFTCESCEKKFFEDQIHFLKKKCDTLSCR